MDENFAIIFFTFLVHPAQFVPLRHLLFNLIVSYLARDWCSYLMNSNVGFWTFTFMPITDFLLANHQVCCTLIIFKIIYFKSFHQLDAGHFVSKCRENLFSLRILTFGCLISCKWQFMSDFAKTLPFLRKAAAKLLRPFLNVLHDELTFSYIGKYKEQLRLHYGAPQNQWNKTRP